MKRLAYCSLAFFLLLVACEPTPTEFVELNAYVRYIEPEGTLRAIMTVRSGPDSSKLAADTIQRKIYFQNQVVPRRETVQGFRYQLDEPTARPGQIYVNLQAASKGEIGGRYDFADIRVAQNSIRADREKGLEISWDGPALQAGENMICMLSDSLGQTLTFPVPSNQSNPIRIPAQTLQGLHAGTGNAYIIRQMQKRQEQKGSRFILQSEYYSKEFRISVP